MCYCIGFEYLWFRSYVNPISLQSHLMQLHPLYSNTNVGNCFTGLCTKCTGYNSNLLIAAQNSGTSSVVVERFDCIIQMYLCTKTALGAIVLVSVDRCSLHMCTSMWKYLRGGPWSSLQQSLSL